MKYSSISKLLACFALCVTMINTSEALAQSVSSTPNCETIDCGSVGDISAVHFTNANTGYAVGYTPIMKTTDGGITWTTQTTGYNSGLWAIHFPSENIGYAVGGSGKIIKTSDAGATWTRLASGSTDILWSTFFLNDNKGFAVGNYGTILRTLDGGDTWTSIDSPADSRLYAISFLDDNIGYAAGQNGTIIKTIDGGDTWTELSSNIVLTLRGLSITDANTVYITINGGNILKTTDGGDTWTVLETGVSTVVFNSIHFTNSNTGYAVGWNGKIIYTTDAGTTWTEIQSNSTKQLTCIYFQNPNTGYVVGNSSTLIKISHNTDENNLKAPELLLPSNLSIINAPTTSLKWKSVNLATNYNVQLATDSMFANISHELIVSDTMTTIDALLNQYTCYWKVQAVNSTDTGAWSAICKFHTDFKYSISGTIQYDNSVATPMSNCIIIAKDSSGAEIAKDTSDANGNYKLDNLSKANYNLQIITDKAPGGVNTFDVITIRQYIVNLITLSPIQIKACDINQNQVVNGTDVLPIRRKLANYPEVNWRIPNYVFYPDSITINDSDTELNIKSLCGGDVNRSYTPPIE